jgi:hypothetical protein
VALIVDQLNPVNMLDNGGENNNNVYGGEITTSLNGGHQLFIPLVIHAHRELRRNDIDRVKLIPPPQLSGKPTTSHLVAKQEELTRK